MIEKKKSGTPEQPPLVSEFNAENGIAVPSLLLALTTTILLFCFDARWYWHLVTWVGAFAAMYVILQKTFIELDRGIVREEVRLYGVVVLARGTTLLSEFEAVVVQHFKGGPEDDGDDWRVGLQHCSGRRIWMRYYQRNVPWRSDPEDAVSAFAVMLSEKMKLPIQDIDPPDAGQWFRRVKLRKSRRGSA